MNKTMTTPAIIKRTLCLAVLLCLACIKLNAAIITVTNTNSTGAGSFDAAITSAISGDVIRFNFATGSAPFVINLPHTELINVANLTIDGSTANGYAGAPVVQLDGSANGLSNIIEVYGSGAIIIGLSITNGSNSGIEVEANNCTIQNCYIGVKPDGITTGSVYQGIFADGVSGLNVDGVTRGHNVIVTGGNPAIWLSYNGATGCTGALIKGTYIGTNASGSAGIGACGYGIYMDYSSTGNTIGGAGTAGNLISNCSNYGIYLGAGSNVIKGNMVGLNAAGTAAIPNFYGIYDLSNGDIIGGTAAGEGNVVSGNNSDAIVLDGFSGCKNTLVIGNYIGTNAAGTAAVANQAAGINITGNTGSTNIVIGGTTAASRNIISGNKSNGVIISQAPGTTVKGNYIGLNAAGTAAIPNSTGLTIPAINVSSSSGVVIGGGASGSGNVISGNTGDGISISSGSAVTVQGNIIGLNAAGASALANGRHGITISSTASNTIGGTAYLERNFISGNVSNGMLISAAGTHTISNNFIGLNKSGVAVGNGNDGILVSSGSPTIGTASAGAINYISGNTKHGIEITGSSVAVINCYIGTDSTGTAARPNGQNGVNLTSGSNLTIGGLSVNTSNLISGNTGSGINVASSGTNFSIFGNKIGTNKFGTAALANANGISVSAGSSIKIGSGTGGAGNTISGNTSSGISVAGTSTGLKIQGNYIGTAASGTSAIANGTGITWTNTGTGNFVGTDSDGTTDATELNIISGNTVNGISLSGNNLAVTFNYIGLDKNGTAALPNATGITISGTATSNTIGGTTAVKRNTISGNTSSGIVTSSTGANTVAGNYIGLNAAGTSAIPNLEGIRLTGNNTTVGGIVSGSANIISGNTQAGINITGASASSNSVQGNYIGTNTSGTGAIANGTSGVVIASSATGNTIGGTSAAALNVISGNAASGINLGSSSNVIAGNYIGLNLSGTAAVPNNIGITVTAGSNNIGLVNAGNVISGNTSHGISLAAGANTNSILGNYMGTNAAGTSAIVNGGSNILLTSSSNNTIGSSTAGGMNILAGNTGGTAGIEFGTGSNNNTLQGNYIGLGLAGALPNGSNPGVLVSGATGTIIDGNIISGSNNDGIKITANSATIISNFIGTTSTGAASMANTGNGINVTGTATGVIIGGTSISSRNIISGNTLYGINLGTGGNTVKYNYIGINQASTASISNGSGGISSSVGGNTINNNIISGNSSTSGIDLTGGSGDVIKANYIGLDFPGVTAIPNNIGINIGSSVSNVTIGGSIAADGNLISGNTSDGVRISGSNNTVKFNTIKNNVGKGIVVTSGTNNMLSQNSISGNSLGIDLGNNGVTLNDAGDADAGANNLQNYPVITSVSASGGNTTVAGTLNSAASATYNLEFFENTAIDPGGYGQGETYIGATSVTTSAGGNGSFSVVLPGNHIRVSATATNATNNTSEFSLSTLTEIAVSYNSVNIPDGSTTPPVMDSTSIGAPITRTYRIDNSGTEDLNLSLLTLPTGFSLVGTLPAVIAPGTSANLLIQLDAVVNGTFTGQVSFATNDANENPFNFSIYGWVGCWNANAGISGTTAICENASAPLITFTGSGGVAPYTFTYQLNGGSDQTITTSVGNSVTVSVPASTAGTYTYTLVSVSDSRSASCIYAATGSAVVTVNPLPSATISGTTSVCKNAGMPVITFTGSGATAPYTFTYNVNGGSNQTATTASGNSVTVSVPTGTAGTYTYSLVSVQDASTTACSNAASGTAIITVNNQSTGDISAIACDSYTWNGVTYTATPAVDPTMTLTNMTGCDSVVTLHLTINNNNSGSLTVNACDSYTWNGITYTSTPAIDPTMTLANITGCDSVVTLHLTINNSNSGSVTVNACDNYTWNSITYTSTPAVDPTMTLTNMAGCDSVVTLHLTISNSNSGSVTMNACDSYTWNSITYTSTPAVDPTMTLTNITGCDSVVTLHLTINNSNNGSVTVNACDNYTWNSITYTSTPAVDPTMTLTNMTGCDSVVTLHLTINTIDLTVSVNNNSLTSNDAFASYQWIDCDNGDAIISGETNQTFTATQNGNYAVIVTNSSCSDTSACQNVISAGIAAMNPATIIIFPNPTSGPVNIFVGNQKATITLLEVTGKQIETITTENNTTFDLSRFADGVYFIKVQTKSDTTIYRVMKQ